MNMLPLPFNNSEPSFKDLIEEQTDVFQISQLDIIDSLESIKKIQKDIFDISFKMYNLQEEQFELAKSQLFDQKEFMDEQRRALNNSRTNFGGDTSSNNNETVSQLPGGAGGGSNGMMGFLSRGRPGTRPGPGSGPRPGPGSGPRPGGFLKSGLKGFLKGGPMALATSLIIDFAGGAALDIIADGVEDPEAKAKVRSIGETALKGISIAAAFAIGGPYVGLAAVYLEGIDLLNKKIDTETKRIKNLTDDPLLTPKEKADEAAAKNNLPSEGRRRVEENPDEDRNMLRTLRFDAATFRSIDSFNHHDDKSVIAEKEQLTLATLLKHKERIDDGTIKPDARKALGAVADTIAVALKNYPDNPRITNTVKDIVNLVESKGGNKKIFVHQIERSIKSILTEGGGEKRQQAAEQLMTPIYQDRKIEPPKAPSTSVTDEIQIPDRKIEPPKAPSTSVTDEIQIPDRKIEPPKAPSASVTQVDEPPKAPSTSTDVPNGTDKNSGVHPLVLKRIAELKARLKAEDTNKDGNLSGAELKAANAKVQPLLPGGAAQLDAAGKLNTSTDVSNGTDNTSTDVSNGTDNTSTSVPGKKPISSTARIALKEAKKRAARLKAADTNKDGELSRAELEALHAKESQERADLFGTTDLGAALDAGKLNTSTDVSNGTDNTSTNFSDMMDAYDAKLLALVEGGHEITDEMIQDLLLSEPRLNVPKAPSTSVTQLENGTGGEIPNSVTQVGSDSNFGSIAARFESNGKPGTISTGKGDHGGKSYGMFQLASRGGASNNEVEKFLNESGYSEKFNGMKVGSSEFDAQWKKLAKEDSGFGEAQSSYAKKSYYDPQMKNLQRSGIDLSGKGRSVQESIMSTANQYGPNTDLIREALKGKDPTNMTDKEIVNAIQDYKADTVDTRFRSSSKNDREGVARRIERERTALLNFPDDKTAKQLMEGPLEGSGNSGNKNAAPPVIVDGRTFNNNSSTSAPASPSRPIEVAAINIQQKFSDYSTLSGYNG
jgi:hypothetical protein